ncbi:MAG: acetylxylan esterase [Opitutaceae bacterium]|nr:acetylxylan esterase [Opitutaceae bacterium]
MKTRRVIGIFTTVLIGSPAAIAAPAAPSVTAGAAAWSRLERYSIGFAYPGTQLKDYVYARSARHFAQGDAARDGIKTAEQLRERQARIRQFMIESVGGLPASDTPLNARVTGVVPGKGFTIEKIIFESRPRHYVTANLYLPEQRTGRTGAVLFLSGHHATAKQVAEYQNVCQTLVQAGLIVLAQDPVGQGERHSYYDPETKKTTVRPGTGEHEYAGVQARFVGDQIARYFLHDAMRGIDYLLTRPEVDPARIGVTGNSGGGTQTSLVMLADPRLAAAAPGTFITSREAYQWTNQGQDAEQNWFGFTSAGFDHEDILLAMAPKPVCVLAVTSDFFPIEGTRRTVERARRAWAIHGRGPMLELAEDLSLHSYTPNLARAAARFFARHLLQREIDISTLRPEAMPEPTLWATKSGQVRGELTGAEFVFEANVARLSEAEALRRRLPKMERNTRAMEWLRAQVFNGRESLPPNPRYLERGSGIDGLLVDVAFWWSQPRLANLGMLFRARGAPASLPVTIALWDDGTNALGRHATWLREECGRGRAVLVLDVCGVGPLRPDALNSRSEGTSGTFRKLVDDLSFIGDSLVALRTFETLRALEVLAGWPGVMPTEFRVHGHGRMGIHARLAATIEPRIAGSEWLEPFRFSDLVRDRNYDATDIKEKILPAALRYFDLDELEK